ncbi:hypothetical protein E3N88_34602 [Mikania micrantha]|uniref:VQ domain-containing protein n=1 Tax=Mikania micrantha TaxID=192012 RepID=A0A5N6LYZ0_9ASTR|nr:hypothetical protein E3N88_34602 [Mikania micrantha]
MPRSRRAEPVKVVIINTEYVETDAMNFKSVVQRLTGKDAPSPTSSQKKSLSHCDGGFGGDRGSAGGCGDRAGLNSLMLENGISFSDFDKLMLELPTMDDVYQLYVE